MRCGLDFQLRSREQGPRLRVCYFRRRVEAWLNVRLDVSARLFIYLPSFIFPMKAEIHPDYKESTIQCTCGAVYSTRSTVNDLRVGICAACHPFFTGEQRFVDTAGRVEKFAKRYGDAQERRAEKPRREVEPQKPRKPKEEKVEAEKVEADKVEPEEATEKAPAAKDPAPETAPAAEAAPEAAVDAPEAKSGESEA